MEMVERIQNKTTGKCPRSFRYIQRMELYLGMRLSAVRTNGDHHKKNFLASFCCMEDVDTVRFDNSLFRWNRFLDINGPVYLLCANESLDLANFLCGSLKQIFREGGSLYHALFGISPSEGSSGYFQAVLPDYGSHSSLFLENIFTENLPASSRKIRVL